MYYKIYNFCARIGWDRWAHALVFSVVTRVAIQAGLHCLAAILVAVALAVAKELYDKHKGGSIDKGDLIADIAGIALGLI